MPLEPPYKLEDVYKIFEGVYNADPGSLRISEIKAEKICAKRKNDLSQFLEDQPPDIIELFSNAIKKIDMLHSWNKKTIEYQSNREQYNDFNEIDFLVMASNKLDDYDKSQNSPKDFHEIRKNVIIGIKNNLEGNLDWQTLRDVLDEIYPEDNFNRIAAVSQTSLMLAISKQLSFSYYLLRFTDALQLVARGIFYNLIINKFGARLGRLATQEEIEKPLRDIPSEILGRLGDLIAPVKILYELISAFAEHGQNINKYAKKNSISYVTMKSYIVTFHQALDLWWLWVSDIEARTQSLADSLYAPLNKAGDCFSKSPAEYNNSQTTGST
jgi:hypothetical protein